ncbi:hypothetical protein MTR67_036129 [Solanum verrucosum]|uniref:Uncharacterized protein n=1 Tax=Solanum verrucosum TaxID=315347 RepID=A0AAF0UBG4_SOLVR|nr:hypothetical protein MTR67_036129 [Solanum verrucosum]
MTPKREGKKKKERKERVLLFVFFPLISKNAFVSTFRKPPTGCLSSEYSSSLLTLQILFWSSGNFQVPPNRSDAFDVHIFRTRVICDRIMEDIVIKGLLGRSFFHVEFVGKSPTFAE